MPKGCAHPLGETGGSTIVRPIPFHLTCRKIAREVESQKVKKRAVMSFRIEGQTICYCIWDRMSGAQGRTTMGDSSWHYNQAYGLDTQTPASRWGAQALEKVLRCFSDGGGRSAGCRGYRAAQRRVQGRRSWSRMFHWNRSCSWCLQGCYCSPSARWHR